MKKGKANGKRHGDRDTWVRFRMSKEERAFLQGATSARGVTMSLVVRQLLAEAGYLPASSAEGNILAGYRKQS